MDTKHLSSCDVTLVFSVYCQFSANRERAFDQHRTLAAVGSLIIDEIVGMAYEASKQAVSETYRHTAVICKLLRLWTT